MSRRWLWLALVSCPGCYLHATAGYSSGVQDVRGLRGGELAAHGGVNTSRGPAVWSLGAQVAGRASEREGHVAVGPEAMVRYVLRYRAARSQVPCEEELPDCFAYESPFLTPMQLYARGGAALVQLGSMDGAFGFGMLSPNLELGSAFSLSGEDVPLLTLSTKLEHDLQLTGQPGITTVGFMIGLAFFKVRAPGDKDGLDWH